MTPDVVVDIGNSRVKWGRVRDGRIDAAVSLAHDDPVGWKRQAEEWGVVGDLRWAVAGVVPLAVGRFAEWLRAHGADPVELTSAGLYANRRHLPVRTAVRFPEKLGVDRWLGALAAKARIPESASAVAISVGTAMTVDFVQPDGTHVGGAILPGPRLMARSLHRRTAKLPRIRLTRAVPTRAWGDDTERAINLGVASAVLGAADQLAWDWSVLHPTPWVFVTGGDSGYFRDFVLTADVASYRLEPNLVLDGIRLAAEAMP